MPSERQPVRFGVFEVHLDTGEVRRAGVKVRMQEQPFQVLAALLEKPGEIVTKEELQERIWKDDTFVDFDRSLATAINKVRQALGDSATRPRFVETVPKRGYRFVGLGVEPGAAEPEPAGSRRPWVLGVAVVTILAGSAAWYFSSREETVKWGDPVRITADAGLTFQPTISPDGTLLAYSSDRGGQGNLDIYVQQIGGGGLVRLTDDPADDTAPDFSPDGKSVIFRSERGEGGVYLVAALGGAEPRPLAPHGHRPRYSPDGKWIAYFTGPRASSSPFPLSGDSTYVLPVAGGSPRLLDVGSAASFPVWSPDSTALLVRAPSASHEPQWRAVGLDGVDRGAVGEGRFNHSAPAHWDDKGYIYFSISDADSTDLWRVRVDSEYGRAMTEPERVLPGTGSYWGASLALNGRLAYADVEQNPDLWSISVDANQGAVAAEEPLRLTTSQGNDFGASVSQDGARIIFLSNRAGKNELQLFDVASREERRLGVGPPDGVYGSFVYALNAAGTRIVGRVKDRLSIMTLDGIVEKELPVSLAFPHDWSSDERLILLGHREGTPATITLLDLGSGLETTLLSDPDKAFFQGQFSPDGRWLAWMTEGEGVQIARLEGAQPIPESERIQISEEGYFADKPRWSPDGNLLYYTSDRDGFVCLYAQLLDPETKQPQGELLEIYHSHRAQLSMGNVGAILLTVDVAQDKIILGMTELKGNIWMLDPVE